ncbi:MAG: hypothetical protein Q4C64_05205 [Erysipelotrichia bacterium]|nr:hypothetical protein [Erysipelotrichia bacterium]
MREQELFAKYNRKDIKDVFICCAHSNYSYSYSFELLNRDDNWFFSFSCCDYNMERIEKEDIKINLFEVEKLLEMFENSSDEIKQNKSVIDEINILDKTDYYLKIKFKDNKIIRDNVRVTAEIEKYLYDLAIKYRI